MFDSITLLHLPSLGQLAELILFYRRVTIFLEESSIRELFQKTDPKLLVPFFEDHRDNLDIRWLHWGVWTSSGLANSSIQGFQLGDEDSMGVDEPYLDYLRRTNLLDTPNGAIANTDLTHRFLSLIKTESVSYEHFSTIFNSETLNNEIPNYIKQYIKAFPTSVPRIPNDLTLNVTGAYGRFNIEVTTNQRLSRQRLLFINSHISSYIETMSTLPIYSNLSSEIFADEQVSFRTRSKINTVVNRFNKSQNTIQNFQEVFLNEAKNIKQVIDSQERSFIEFIQVYEKSYEFREWIADQSADANLLREYYLSVTSDSWFERLPNKMARWALFTGLGLGIDALGAGGIGLATGITLGAFDTFLLDKLLHGWKPNQFIDRELRGFLED